MDKKKMKAEALYRMKQLQDKFALNPKLLKYLEDDKLYYSYRVSGWAFGCIDSITYDKNYAEAVDMFERESGNYVYHVIETRFMGQVRVAGTQGAQIAYLETENEEPVTMLTFLYVSPDEYAWRFERPEGEYIFAYVFSIDGCQSEYGDVILTSDNGALLRRA